MTTLKTPKGILLIVSGAAGTGKGTVNGMLLRDYPNFAFSVSATTRAPRPGEIDGREYHFLSREQFEEQIKNDGVIEYTEYCGNYYGTPKKEVYENLAAGRNVILEIDVQGALQIKERCPDAILLMIAPPDYRTLEKRLRGRGDKVSEDVIRERLEAAAWELSKIGEYDYIVINGDNAIDCAAQDVIHIVQAEKLRTERAGRFETTFFAE